MRTAFDTTFFTHPRWREFSVASALALCFGIQALVLISMTGWGQDISALAAAVYPEWAYLVRPERETFLFRAFVVMCVLFQGVFMFILCARPDGKNSRLQDGVYAGFEFVLTALLLCAAYKMVIYDARSQLAEAAIRVLLGVAVLAKIFWTGIGEWFRRLYGLIEIGEYARLIRSFAFWFLGAMLVVFMYMPDLEAVAARMFIGEQYHHFDSFIAAPGWAHRMGRLLNMDIITQYGVGMPVILSELSRVFGPYGYVSLLATIMWLCISYYVGWYVLLRKWYGSVLIASAAILAAFRVQMFHTGTFPFVFTYPSALPIRYIFDIGLFWLLWIHLHDPRQRYMAFMGLLCGTSLFYMTDTGLYLTAAFVFYGLFQLVCPSLRKDVWDRKRWYVPLTWMGIPVVTYFFLMWVVQGHHLWSSQFWYNMGEFIEYFLSGWGVVPMYASLLERHFWASLMGFSIPLVYVATLTIVGSLIFLKKRPKQDLFAVILCVYGLGIYHYYIARSAVTSYYTAGLPFMFICGYWIIVWIQSRPARQHVPWAAAVFGVSLFALVTNHNFVSYPNLVNVFRNPMTDAKVVQPLPNRLPYFNHLYTPVPESDRLARNSLGQRDEELLTERDFISDAQLVQYYRQARLFPEDVALIQGLIPENQPVALISSFEVELMVQSRRAPFFYYYPLVISRPMKMRTFPVSSLYTQSHWKRTENQLETARPEFVFLEKIFLSNNIPAHYAHDRPGMMILLGYVKSHYEPYAQGKYLVAMKRK